MIAPDQWDDLIVAVLVGLTVITAAVGALVKALLTIRADVKDAQRVVAATHQSIQVDNGNGSLRTAINKIAAEQQTQSARLSTLEDESRETRRDVGGMRSDVRALHDRDAEDRETSRVEHGRLWQAIRARIAAEDCEG